MGLFFKKKHNTVTLTYLFKLLDIVFSQWPINVKPISWVQHNRLHLKSFYQTTVEYFTLNKFQKDDMAENMAICYFN